jgi:hypothetical protein
VVLTKSELIASLQNEVRILLHLCTKIDRRELDYRPTPGQRSTLDLLHYLTVMGPALIRAAKAGAFDGPAFGGEERAAQALDFDQTIQALASHSDTYAALLSDIPDDDFRETITMFGRSTTRGAFIVNLVLGGCAAYRTQLFLYLKACGREELGTINLWGGRDAPAAAAKG